MKVAAIKSGLSKQTFVLEFRSVLIPLAISFKNKLSCFGLNSFKLFDNRDKAGKIMELVIFRCS